MRDARLKRLALLLFALLVFLKQAAFASSPHYGLIPDVALWEPPPESIHIDPENNGDTQRDGTIEHPFLSFHDSGFPWVEGGIYVLKRGTTLSGPSVEIRTKGITIASYGSSAQRPKYVCTSIGGHTFYTWDAARSDITIRDIEIEAGQTNSAIRLMRAANSDMIRIINCKLRGGGWGLRLLFTSQVLVENVEVYDTADDGMFIQGVTNIEIRNCYIHHVNTNWKPPQTPESEAGGDGIQLDACNHWHVHHNLIDRTSSGNKFCFISNNPDQTDGVLEHNYMTGPLVDGHTVYMHNGDGMIIRNNVMVGPAVHPFYSHGTNILFTGNIIVNIDKPAYTSQSAIFRHNVFYRTGGALSGGTIQAENNIFVMRDGTSPYGSIARLTQSNNYTAGNGAPLFIDPEQGDFRLRPESPCIMAGTDDDTRQDIDATQAPMGITSDIGAIEYRPAAN